MIKLNAAYCKLHITLSSCVLFFTLYTTYVSGFAFLFYEDGRNLSNYLKLQNSTSFRIDPSFLGGSSSNIQAVRDAFNTWRNGTLRFNEVSSNEKAYFNDAYRPREEWLAVTYINYSGRTITDFTTTFNTAYSWSTHPDSSSYDIGRVALHEVGHGLGLDHPNQANINYTCSGKPGLPYTGQEVMISHVSSGLKSHELETDDACGRNYIYPQPLDSTPPATITDLTLLNITTDSAVLQWHAPGDDGSQGRATSYDLRYSTSSITTQNFSSATRVSGVFAPQTSGKLERFTINNLQPGTLYYFAIKSSDESNNISAMSDVPTGTTLLDSDGDGISDTVEAFNGTDPTQIDTDMDGMTDPYELAAGTSATDEQSYQPYLFRDNFDDGNVTGWTRSGGSGVSWKNVGNTLEAKVTGSNGYSFFSPPIDMTLLKDFTFSFDITYLEGALWGGYAFWGIHTDMNPSLYRIRDRISQKYPGISAGMKHHVFVKVQKSTPFYKCDTYVDGILKKANEPIEIGFRPNQKISLASPYYKGVGKVVYDNYNLWPGTQPLTKELLEDFDSQDLGPWVITGGEIQWTFVDGALRATPKTTGTSYGYLKNAIWNLRSKDVLMEFDIGLFNGATSPAGVTYRGYRINLTPSISLNKMHHAILILDQNGADVLSTLYVDGTRIFENKLIDPSSFTVNDNTSGFYRQNGAGIVQWDHLSIMTQDSANNLPPVLMPIGTKEVKAGEETLQFQLQAVSPDGDPIIYSCTGDILLCTSLDSSTGEFIWSSQNQTAGVYEVIFSASDESGMDEETVQIIATQGEDARIILEENFNQGLLPSDLVGNWQAIDSSNVNWTLEKGKLKGTVLGANYKYSKIAPFDLDVSNMTNLAVEYDVIYMDGARWGGIWYRGISGDLNPTRSGWRDGNFQKYTGIASNKRQHIILLIGQDSFNPPTSARANAGPLFKNEPIQTTQFPNSTVGFVSPYYGGSMFIDNFKVHDLSPSALPPPTPLIFYEDFSRGNFDGWITQENKPGVRWSVTGGKLVSKAVGDDAYSYLWPFAVDVSGKNILIEFDAYYSNSIPWGGLYYRGVHLDLFKRIGWRDQSPPTQYLRGLPANTKHHIVLNIRPRSPYSFSDLYVNGKEIFKDEPIQKTSFSNNSVGFVSVYDNGSYSIDNFLIQENPPQ